MTGISGTSFRGLSLDPVAFIEPGGGQARGLGGHPVLIRLTPVIRLQNHPSSAQSHANGLLSRT